MPAQFGLMVSDQLTTHVHGYFVNLSGEWKRRLILGSTGAPTSAPQLMVLSNPMLSELVSGMSLCPTSLPSI